jgi:hypothetical protein
MSKKQTEGGLDTDWKKMLHNETLQCFIVNQ